MPIYRKILLVLTIPLAMAACTLNVPDENGAATAVALTLQAFEAATELAGAQQTDVAATVLAVSGTPHPARGCHPGARCHPGGGCHGHTHSFANRWDNRGSHRGRHTNR